MSVATAPNKDLVDGLIAQRRERYRRIRQDGRHAEYTVLPAPTTVNGTASAAAAPAHTTTTAKAQKQSTAHLLLRMLGLSFIVPLSRLDEAGLPSSLDREGFGVKDAVGFMSSLLIERPDTLEHVFSSRPNNDERTRRQRDASGTEPTRNPYESTTLLPWLLPRILCAAATLSLRIAEANVDSGAPQREVLLSLRQDLMDLSFLVLDLSMKRSISMRTLGIARATLQECMRASIRALSSVGKSTFHYSSAPPIELLPIRRADDDKEVVTTFFDANASDSTSMRIQARLLGDAKHQITMHGNGISGLWMSEDYATFTPPWSQVKDRSMLAHALFLHTCTLMLQLERFHAPLMKDMGDTAATLLHSNWLLSLVSLQSQQFDERAAAFAQLSKTASPLIFDRLTAISRGLQDSVMTNNSADKQQTILADQSPNQIDNTPPRRSVHDLTALAKRDLVAKSRAVRLKCAREIATSVKQICEEASAAKGFDPSVKHFDGLFSTLNNIIKADGQTTKVKETLILCLAQLGRIDSFDVLQKVLHCLVLQLGSDPLTKSLAYTTITQLATHRRCTTFQLLAPHFDVIAPEVVERMAKSPMLFLELLQLTRQSQSKFLQATLQYTLPRIIELEDNNCLNLIAKGIGADVQSMCLTNAPAVLKSLLMLLPPPRRDRCIHTFVEKVRGADAGGEAATSTVQSGITLKSLLKGYSVELLGHLVIRLGDPIPIQRKRALEGLQCMDTVLNDRERRANRSANSRGTALAQYLKDEILAILSWLNEELMNVHGKRSMAHKSMVTRSIGALIDLIGKPISYVTPQLMATLNTTMQVRELMLPTLESWNTFVLRARSENVGPFIGQAAAALLASWSKFGEAEKSVANNILTHVVVDHYKEFQKYLSGEDFPDLSDVKDDIPEVWAKLSLVQRSSPVRPDHRLMHILSRASNDNTSVCKQALLELRTFLCTGQAYLESATSGNAFDDVVGRMIRCLFDTTARSGDDEESIRDLSLEILGIIGAVDPDRLPYASSEQVKVPLNDFNDKEELTTFAVHLISDVLVSAYKTTHDTKHQAALAYAIQELLKFCGFTNALLPARDSSVGGQRTGGGSGGGASVNLKTRQRWNALVKYVDTLAPLLESKYVVQHSSDASSTTPSPFYSHTSSFKEWIQSWTNALIVGTSGDHAKIVFDVFRSVIKDHDLSIAQYILPHLVLNTVTMGDEEQQDRISIEIVTVLQDQIAEQPIVGAAERRLLSAQVVFGLLDHMSVWQRARQREKVRREGRQDAKQHRSSKRDAVEGAISRVDVLMKTISQDLMAQASLQCRAYARSLLNHEQQIRTLRQEAQKAAADEASPSTQHEAQLQSRYEDLHLIYANLDEPDGMEGISSLVLRPSLEHQIREHESTGRWTSAQSCWEVKIQESPNELDLHVGLLRCLRNLGHYDTMRTHIRGVLAVHQAWSGRLAPFYIEGCCILSDWKEVRHALRPLPAPDSNGTALANTSPQHAMARVMLAMHDHDAKAFEVAVKDARRLLGKPLVVGVRNNGSRNSSDYIAVYDTVAQLHMLHELGMIASALGLSSAETPTRALSTNDLKRSLSLRLDSTLPSFRTREPLLSMRRSALSTQQDDAKLREIAGQCWIASSKIARRERHLQTAYSAALQASQCRVSLAFVQHAKLLAIADQDQAALQEMVNSLPTVSIDAFKTGNPADMHSYANAHLFAARLSDASGRRHPNEIVEMYKRCTELDSYSEKMWYHLGRYYDQLQDRDTAAVRMIHLANPLMQHYNTCRYFLRSALHGTKYFYRTVPRVLTIWLTISDEDSLVTEMRRSKSASKGGTSKSNEQRTLDEQVTFFTRINDLVHRAIEKLAPFQWLAVFPQLLSRVAHRNDKVWSVLQDLISYVLTQYPDQAMWSMAAGLQSTDKKRKERFESIVARVKASAATLDKDEYKSKVGAHIIRTIDQMVKMAKELLYLCDYQIKEDVSQMDMQASFPALLALARKGDLILPMQSSLSVTMPSTGTVQPNYTAFSDNLPRIVDLDSTIKVMTSLQRPRKIVIKASDGQSYAFLCKPKDDLRKDARLMEFDSMINNLLQSNPESRKRRLYIRTYAVVTLNEECGLIEWVPNTIGLRFILTRLYGARGIEMYSNQLKTDMEAARKDPKKAASLFENKILSRYPPLFHEWFVTTFPEPSAWLTARLNYGRTLAVMSMVGYVLGLGDRHGENILFDAVSGDTVHVDLNCLFERGATFDIPERVPFRLTQNLVDALGVTGVEGVFRKAAEISMNILREHRDSLMSVLEAMVHDPLVEWGLDTRNAKARSNTTLRVVDPRVIEARKSLDPVSRKLLGQLRRTTASGATAGVVEPGALLSGGWTSSHSTNSLVDALIRDATSSLLLSQMYIGWTPYL